MRNLIALLFCLISLSNYGQEAETGFDGHKWESPYVLPIPKDWTIERFLIPISFAPQINYSGVEDIRFAPGWGKAGSEEYWTYAFLWYLDGSPETNAKIIAGNLTAYYTGLIGINSDSTRAGYEKPVQVKASFKKLQAYPGDVETYSGSIEMTDYMQQKPIVLNCLVHLKACPEEDKTILFHELSPQPFTHKNWTTLNQIWSDFRCIK